MCAETEQTASDIIERSVQSVYTRVTWSGSLSYVNNPVHYELIDCSN
jgi:hypothetical protein